MVPTGWVLLVLESRMCTGEEEDENDRNEKVIEFIKDFIKSGKCFIKNIYKKVNNTKKSARISNTAFYAQVAFRSVNCIFDSVARRRNEK